MTQIAYANIALQAFGGFISLMIILFLALCKPKRTRQDRLYVRFLVCNSLLQAVNILSWVFDGLPGEMGRYVVHAINFLMFALAYLLIGLFTDYFTCFLAGKGIESQRIARLTWGLLAIALAMSVIFQWNGMYFVIDAQNFYQRGPWYWLSNVAAIAAVLPAFWLLVNSRDHLSKKEFYVFFSYFALPILGLVRLMFFYGWLSIHLATTFVAIYIYIYIQAEQSYELSQKELELEKSRTSIMLSQIQPHFLYNALESIRYLCREQPEQAEKLVLEFALFLRGNMDTLCQTAPIPFSQELAHTQHYLAIEQVRFGSRIQVELTLSCADFQVPALTLQPLVENAVRHGVSKREQGGMVRIETCKVAGGWKMTVTDNGPGCEGTAGEQDGRSHIELSNVKSRLALQCGGTLDFVSTPGEGSRAVVFIPAEGIAPTGRL